ncbi:MAG: LPS export ABC transporter permease LptF [Gammaproteobacteria bacterium]|nr:MAG: LPS export ABC transporter permease LptF [Gammaproteobacteria bacterium]
MGFLRLSIIDRYLLREISQVLLSVLFVLLLITLSSQLVRFLTHAAVGDWPADVVMPMLGLTAINSVALIMPMAVLLAVIMTVGRMYRDSEIVVMKGCGVSTWQLYKPLGLLAFFLALTLGWLSFFVLPDTKLAAAFIEDEAEKSSELMGISPGRFQESHDGKRAIYVESIDKEEEEVGNIFVHYKSDGEVSLLTAATAYQYQEEETGDQLIVLKDGFRYTGIPGETSYREIEFKIHWIRLKEGKKGKPRTSYETKPTRELIGSENLFDQSELHWRISMMMSPVLFTLLGLPLGRIGQREGRYGRVMVGVLIYLIYFKLLRVGQVLIENETTPAWLGLWWVHAGLICYLAWTLFKERKVKSGGMLARWRFSKAK